MITSILDTDLYKFTMQQAILELFPDATAEYVFINRGNHKFNQKFDRKLAVEIEKMSSLKLDMQEKIWFRDTCKYFKPNYFEYLHNYRFNPDEVKFQVNESDGNLILRTTGPWHRTVLWEVPLLALISEIYFSTIDTSWDKDYVAYNRRFGAKMELLQENSCHITEFGTRRRRNSEVQRLLVKYGKTFPCFGGTSNVYLSMINNLVPRGTMAHEWIMAMSVLEGLRNANYYALQNWVRIYNASLGIALTDTYGLEAFLNNFNLRLSKLYDGVRHDSGDPFIFVDKIVKHYIKLGIDPSSKVAFFSDNLNPEKVVKINEYCKGKIKASFGIGTNLTNDFAFCNSPALNMVIKMSKLNNVPVVKLSDERGKECGDRDALRIAKWTFYNQPLDGLI